jgi:hypothetical protein
LRLCAFALKKMTLLLLPANAKPLLPYLAKAPHAYGWLLSPKRTMTITGLHGLPYAVDNDCFTQPFNPDRYHHTLARLARAHGTTNALFATAPDVFGDAQRTLDLSLPWLPRIRAAGFPAALVAQDGLEDLDIDWSQFDAIFIGGTTAWKLSQAADIIRTAKELGKWTHIGRVNSVHRACRLIEQPDSVDGTAWAKNPTKYILQWQRWLDHDKPVQLSMLAWLRQSTSC